MEIRNVLLKSVLVIFVVCTVCDVSSAFRISGRSHGAKDSKQNVTAHTKHKNEEGKIPVKLDVESKIVKIDVDKVIDVEKTSNVVHQKVSGKPDIQISPVVAKQAKDVLKNVVKVTEVKSEKTKEPRKKETESANNSSQEVFIKKPADEKKKEPVTIKKALVPEKKPFAAPRFPTIVTHSVVDVKIDNVTVKETGKLISQTIQKAQMSEKQKLFVDKPKIDKDKLEKTKEATTDKKIKENLTEKIIIKEIPKKEPVIKKDTTVIPEVKKTLNVIHLKKDTSVPLDIKKQDIKALPKKETPVLTEHKKEHIDVPKKDSVMEILKKDPIKEIPKKEPIKEIPKKEQIKEIIKDIPKKEVIKEIPKNEILKEIPKKEIIKEIPKKETIKKIPESVKEEKSAPNIPKKETFKVEKKKEPVKDIPKKESSKKDESASKKIVSPKVDKKTTKKHESVSSEIKDKKKRSEEELSQIKFNKLYNRLPMFSPNLSRSDNEECRLHGEILLRQLRGGRLWALQILDATAKMPSGLLRGNGIQLGDFDECINSEARIRIPGEGIVHVHGRYCLVHIDLEPMGSVSQVPLSLMQAHAFVRSKYSNPGHFIPRFTTLHWGVCLPAACSAADAGRAVKEGLRDYNNTGLRIRVHSHDADCHVRQTKPLRLHDYSLGTVLTIGFYTLVGVIVTIASARDWLGWGGNSNGNNKENEAPSSAERLLSAFSLKKTCHALVAPVTSNDIHSVHGLRAACTILLYIAHKLLPLAAMPMSNRVELTEAANTNWSSIFRGSIIYTDTFLLISGVLTAYHMSKEMETKGHIKWINRYLSRLIRLTPPLLAVLLFYAYIFEHIGEGPQWNTVISTNAHLCKDFMWRNMLYIQNFYPFEKMCATQTHQLALDIQLWALGPLIVWLLYSRPLFGGALTVGLHAASAALRYHATLNHRLSLYIYHGMTVSQLYRSANLLYSQSLHRATPYVAGVGLGVLLWHASSRNLKMPKAVSWCGWLIAAYFASWPIVNPAHMAMRDYVYSVSEAALYSSLCSVAWSLALSWFIFYCFVQPDSTLNCILSSRAAVFLSRISYSVYLTQFIVFFYNVGTVRTSYEFNLLSVVNIYELVIIIIISIILTLTLDLPMHDVRNILMQTSNKSSNELDSNESTIEEHVYDEDVAPENDKNEYYLENEDAQYMSEYPFQTKLHY